MKIKLTRRLPIDSKHGCTKGRVFEVTEIESGRRGKVFFIGDMGEECAAFNHEYKVIIEGNYDESI